MVRRLALLYGLCSLFVLGVFIAFGFRDAEIGALIGALVVAYVECTGGFGPRR